MAIHPELLWSPSPNFGYPRGEHGQLAAKTSGGEFHHSMVGSLQAAKYRFLNAGAQVSAHFLFPRVGIPTQMVDSSDAAWHAAGTFRDNPLPGGPAIGTLANLYFHGFEFEGGAVDNLSEPLTPNQIAWGIKVTHWLRETHNTRRTYVLRETLWEHNWVTPTSCPSGRIPWDSLVAALEEDEMTPEEKAELQRLILAEMDFRVVEKQLTEAVQALQRQGGASEARMRAIAQEEDGRLKVTK